MEERRKLQSLAWVYTMVEEHLHNLFYRCPEILSCKEQVEREVINGQLPPTLAVQKLIAKYAESRINEHIKETSPFNLV